MRLTLRVVGGFLILVAASALAWELYLLATTGKFNLSAWGELWFAAHAPSLNLYQAVVERYISPLLWDNVLAPLLLFPAVLVFLVPGVVLFWLPRIWEKLKKDGSVAQG